MFLLQEQYQFLYDTLEGVYPVQNGEVKAVQASAADLVQIVNETKAAEQPAEEKAEQPASTTSNSQQGGAESTPLVADGGKEDKQDEPENVSSAPTETTPLEDKSNVATVTVEVWEGMAVPFTSGNKRLSWMLSLNYFMNVHCKAFTQCDFWLRFFKEFDQMF